MLKLKPLYIDFETYSEANLLKVGPWAYSRHPSTRVLFMSWAFEDDEPKIWQPKDGAKSWVAFFKNPFFRIHAQNDFFEMCIIKNVLKWPCPGPKYWNDIASASNALALPRSLEGVCGALGNAEEYQKDKDGKRLIKKFCVLVGSKNQKDLFGADPDWEKFKAYGLQDVKSARNNNKTLPELDKKERLIWELDRKINLRGIKIDIESVKNAIYIRDIEQKRINDLARERLNSPVFNLLSPKQVLSFCRRLGVDLENSQKGYLEKKLKEDEIPELARELLKMRLDVAKSSLGKYDKLVDIYDHDTNRAHGLLRYHGATTGRWSGNLFQPQNLTRPVFKDAETCIDLLKLRDPEAIRLVYGDVLEALSSCIRGMLIAEEDHRFVVSDFSQIESRVLAWLAGGAKKLGAYKKGLDIYKVNASTAFKTPYDKIDGYQRTIGKVIELACGYQGGVGAFAQFAELFGLELPEDEVKTIIKAWRDGNKEIVDFWYAVEKGAIKATRSPGKPVRVGPVVFNCMGRDRLQWLFCKLPSGRKIAYHRPKIEPEKFGDKLTFWAVDSVTNKYRVHDTYGGKLVENITQAVARDIMAEKLLQVEKAGYPIVLHVHDEIVAEVKEGVGSLSELNSIMTAPIDWCKEMPIDADGYESRRFKK